MLKLYPDEEHRNSVITFIEKSLHHEEFNVHRDEFIITRKDGEQRHIKFSIYNIIHDEKAFELRVIQGIDVTKRKQAEIKLRESEEKHRILSTITSDYFYSLDIEPAGQIVVEWESGAFQCITGYSLDEINNLDEWMGKIHPDDLDTINNNTKVVLANQPVVSEYRIFTKQGEVLTYFL